MATTLCLMSRDRRISVSRIAVDGVRDSRIVGHCRCHAVVQIVVIEEIAAAAHAVVTAYAADGAAACAIPEIDALAYADGADPRVVRLIRECPEGEIQLFGH